MASESKTSEKAAEASCLYSLVRAVVTNVTYTVAYLTTLNYFLKTKGKTPLPSVFPRRGVASVVPAAGEDESRLPSASRRGNGETGDHPDWIFEHVDATDEWNVGIRSKTHALRAGENYLMDPVMQALRMGAGWDRESDVRASVMLLNNQWMTIDTVSSLHHASSCKGVEHLVNKSVVARDDGNESFSIDLSRLPLNIHHLLFVFSHHDSDAANKNDASVRIRATNKELEDTFAGREIFNYTLATKPGRLTVAGVLSRQGSLWNFKALRIQTTGQSPEQLLMDDTALQLLRKVKSQAPEFRDITIRVLRARNLAVKNPAGDLRRAASPDCFYVIQFKNETFKSNIISQCLDPEWESHSFNMGSVTEAEMKPLNVKVFNRRSSGAQEFMGMIMIPGNAFFRLGEGSHTFWFLLGDGEKKTKHFISGDILVNIIVKPVEQKKLDPE